MNRIVKITLFAIILACSTTLVAQEKTYKDGSVWEVGFIKVGPNMTQDYINSLKNNWNAVRAEAVKQGLIVSYKILEGTAANPDDWDVMLLTEYKNLAAMESMDDKWEAISKKIIGGEDAQKKLNESRVSMRTIFGGKLLREVVYK